MKTHSFFSPQRFVRLLSADIQLNYKRYLFIFAGGLIGFYLLLLFFMPRTYNHYGARDYFFAFIMALFAFGALIGNAFPDLNDKIKTGTYLLLPASTFEKVLSQFLIYVVCGGILLFFLFWVDAHLARWTMQHTRRVISGELVIEPFHFSDLLLETDTFWNLLYILFSVSCGCYLFAARLFFRRFALIKSVIAGVLFFIFASCCLVLFSHLFYPETEGFDMKLPFYLAFGIIDNFLLFMLTFSALSGLFFLPLAYFKLKEKQV